MSDPSPADGRHAVPTLRVGFVPGVTVTKWRRIWADRFPRLGLDVVEIAEADQHAALTDEAVDLCFVRLPLEDPRLHLIPLWSEQPVVVARRDHPVAVFDAVINNSDRKGSHLVRDGGRLRGFDHGVSLHEEPKLRTVLWGFAGDPLPEAELARITSVCDLLEDEDSELRVDLDALLTINEVAALLGRGRRLLDRAAYPMPSGQWPAIPWPPF